jgi:bifunctional non-homologous end joining protein LigD
VPRRQRGARESSGGDDRFVVHQHDARRLHWDLRLEHDGVLASWALPRNFPDDPAHNRLAVRTDDHPLDFLTFDGQIPAGRYGAGAMTIWDQGTYTAEKFLVDKVVVDLHGARVRGRYALFRTDGTDWMIHRMDEPEPVGDPMPEPFAPMAATLSTLPPDDDAWAYEIKWDGVRALAIVEPGRLRLVSRNLRDITSQYPEIRDLTRELGARHAVLDGEIVAFDSEGRPSFQRLQPRMHVTSDSAIARLRREIPVVYVVFDLLYLDGRSLVDEPYAERRRQLESAVTGGASWQVPAYQAGDGATLLAATRSQRLEGIVAKRLDSRYRPGRRSPEWLKIKNVLRQEVVIGGWVPGQGQLSGRFGALLVGYYDPAAGGLRYAGKVGTGFNASDRDVLRDRLAELETTTSPFIGRQPQKESVFVEPRLVCEVEFGEWTAAGTMRHPSYEGLRDDKPIEAVRRERPEAPPG